MYRNIIEHKTASPLIIKRPCESDTGRDELERLLCTMSVHVKPLEPSDLETINRFKDGGFAISLLGFMLYSNGYNLRGTSTHHPNGLLYYDGETLFGLGIFRKTLESMIWHVMISAPRGHGYFAKVDQFVNQLQTLTDSRYGEIYVRHLSDAQYQVFRNHGYQTIDVSPWAPEAPSEDETYNHKLIQLDKIIGYSEDGTFVVKTLEGEENRRFCVKARLAYNRFSNFLERNGLRLAIYDYTPAERDIAETLVRHHFNVLKNPVGSTPEDYLSLINFDSTHGGDQYFGKIGFLENGDVNIPAMLYIGEKTAANTVALYATFANRDTDILGPCFDTSGFSAISQYCYLTLFKTLYDMDVKWVNVGGSETEELNKFKRQLGAQYQASYWVVKGPSDDQEPSS
jgi:hypothetical protein